jgi:hypothetical protein
MLRATLARAERALPPDERFTEYIAAHEPDAVLITPAVWFGSPQTDWVRAARALGVRTAACMFSWDNLTSKGSMREPTDLMMVWNPLQREEAGVHGMPAHRVAITGAQNWDHWFDWTASRTRDELCAEVGLDPSRPIIVYLESSSYMGGEGEFGRAWLRRVRTSADPMVRDANILVRPHPQALRDEWAEVTDVAGVRVWPERGQVPLDGPSREDFYDTLHHADAVVAVNTSAFIEAAILGRPSLTVLLEEIRRAQVNTVHFHHLLEANGGHLIAGRSFDEHLTQLGDALRAGDDGGRGARFVERFVRPMGTDVVAASRWVAEIEELCARPAPAPVAQTADQRRILRAMAPLARAAQRTDRRRLAERAATRTTPTPESAAAGAA